jgi:hypothetical protein
MLFFVVVVAPTVFRALPVDPAGKFLRAMFPRYYAWGMTLALLSIFPASLIHWTLGVLSLIVTLLFVYSRQVLMPKINQARDAQIRKMSDSEPRFERLHRLSVIVNGVQLVTLIGIVLWVLRTTF